jgi:hypothetical protein
MQCKLHGSKVRGKKKLSHNRGEDCATVCDFTGEAYTRNMHAYGPLLISGLPQVENVENVEPAENQHSPNVINGRALPY